MDIRRRHPHSRPAGAASFNRTRRYLLGVALGVAMAAGPPADAKVGKLTVTIDAGTAPITLGELIRQTGLQILFESDAIRDHRTRAVRGRFDPAEALHLMLEGSGLVFEFINERTIAVRPQPPRPPAAKGSLPHNRLDVSRL
jgi:hypothetical protein